MKIITLLYLLTFLEYSIGYGQTISDYNLLMVEGTFDTEAKAELEAMGHTVTIEEAVNLTSGFDYSSYDAIIFMYDSPEPSGISDILSLNINNQLGIILMRGENVLSQADMGTSMTWAEGDFTIENNSHYITQVFSTGILDLGFTYKSNLIEMNSGNTVLGSVLLGNGSLVVNDTFRRVVCPYYGHTDGMPWTSDGEILMDRVIAWAVSVPTQVVNNGMPWKDITLYPNPASDFIRLSGLTASGNYVIYSSFGTEIMKGMMSDNEQIDIRNIGVGTYLLRFCDGNSIIFIKE